MLHLYIHAVFIHCCMMFFHTTTVYRTAILACYIAVC